MPITATDIDRLYQPTKARARMCLDADLVLAIARLEEQLEEARRRDLIENRAPHAPGIAEEIVALREKARATDIEFVFHSIVRRAWTDLLRAHPPTDEQKTIAEKAGGTVEWNPDTFVPALLAASCETPTGTDYAWWSRKYDEWGAGQITRVFAAAIAANQGVAEVPKATEAYALTSASAPS